MRRSTLAWLLVMGCEGGRITVDEAQPGNDTDPATVETDAETDPPESDLPPSETDPSEETDTEPPGTPTCDPGDGQVANLAQPGPHRVDKRDGTAQVRSCGSGGMGWTRYTPRNVAPHPTFVVLSHGFSRGRDKVAAWAEHLASWGFEVFTPTLCHAVVWDTDHEQNGKDLAELAHLEHGNRKVVYVGHSAGGLASVVAASVDAGDTQGVLGLDLVDNSNLGRRTARAIRVPVWGLVGDPGSCNSNGNGRDVYRAAPDGVFRAIAEGTHCDFESPTDAVCTGPCGGILGGGGRFDDATQRRAIRAMMTGFVMAVSEVDPDGVQYWYPGCGPFDALRRSGVVR